MNTVLEFVGTTRCGTQAAEVSQQSQGAAWLLITLKQRAEEKRKISVAIIRAPAVCKLRIDASNGVDMWETVTMLRVLEEASRHNCNQIPRGRDQQKAGPGHQTGPTAGEGKQQLTGRSQQETNNKAAETAEPTHT